MRIGRILTESWHVPKIHSIDRVDRRNHTGNIHFSYTSTNYNRSTCEGFDNLPAEALTPAENALRQMYKANAPA